MPIAIKSGSGQSISDHAPPAHISRSWHKTLAVLRQQAAHMVPVRGTCTVLHCPPVRLLDSQCQARVISLAPAITQVPAGNVVQSPDEAENSQDDKALRTSSNAQSLACDMHSHSSAQVLHIPENCKDLSQHSLPCMSGDIDNRNAMRSCNTQCIMHVHMMMHEHCITGGVPEVPCRTFSIESALLTCAITIQPGVHLRRKPALSKPCLGAREQQDLLHQSLEISVEI